MHIRERLAITMVASDAPICQRAARCVSDDKALFQMFWQRECRVAVQIFAQLLYDCANGPNVQPVISYTQS
jgi:hypothetical protein